MTPTEHRHDAARAVARDALLPADPGIGLDLSLSRQRGGLLHEGRALGESALVAPPVCMGRRGAFHLPPADASSVGPGGLVAGGERAPLTPLCMGVGHGDGMRSGTSFAIARPGNRCAVAHWTSVNANAAFQGDRRMRGADSGVTAGETAPHRRVAQSAEPWVARSSRAPTSSRPTDSPRVGKWTAGGASVAHPAPGRRGEQSGQHPPDWRRLNDASGWGPPLQMRSPFFCEGR